MSLRRWKGVLTYQKKHITLGLGLSVNAKINDDKNQLRISMTTTTEGAASLFRFNVRMVATFKINKKMATDKINEKAKIECAPFVFGVVRDFIALILPGGLVTLRSICLHQISHKLRNQRQVLLHRRKSRTQN